MQEHFHFTTYYRSSQDSKAICRHFLFCLCPTVIDSDVPAAPQPPFGQTGRRRGHRDSSFRKVARLDIRTGMASLCHGKFVHKWLVSRTFPVQPPLPGAALRHQMEIAVVSKTRPTSCLCRRRQLAAPVVPYRKNASRQTVSGDRRHRVLRFQTAMVLWVEAAPSSD
ncbi:hypothetical protein LR69_04580 [Geobacillus sp. BCO2]|nr:hypothetical protein LR69_04580 [Geobacillus sp. BCO2]